MSSNTLRVLEVSTCHVTKETLGRLNEGSCCAPISMAGEYGWLLYVPHPDDFPYLYPTDIQAIIDKARELKCLYIIIDRDAPACEGLEVHEHE